MTGILEELKKLVEEFVPVVLPPQRGKKRKEITTPMPHGKE